MQLNPTLMASGAGLSGCSRRNPVSMAYGLLVRLDMPSKSGQARSLRSQVAEMPSKSGSPRFGAGKPEAAARLHPGAWRRRPRSVRPDLPSRGSAGQGTGLVRPYRFHGWPVVPPTTDSPVEGHITSIRGEELE